MGTVKIPVLLLLGVALGVSCCKDGHRELVKGTSCLAYTECRNGKEAVKTCESDKVFDSNTKTCRDLFMSECSDSSKCNDGDLYQHPTSCRMFYACSGGRLVVNFCGVGSIFDPETGSCKVGYACENDEKIEIVNQRECDEGAREMVDCRGFRTCKDGRWELGTCSLGNVFDKDSLKCVRGSCARRSRRDTHDCVLGEKRRVEGSCKEYTVCEAVGLRNYTCSSCTNFNDDTKQCSFVLFHPCSPSNPPPVPTDPPTPAPTTAPTTAPTPTDATTEPTPTETPLPVTTQPTPTDTPLPVTTQPTPTDTPQPEPETTQPPASDTPQPEPETTLAPATETAQPVPSTQDLKVVTDKTDPTCQSGSKQPVKGECRQYYECDGAKMQLKRCFWPWKFDSVKLECLFSGATCA